MKEEKETSKYQSLAKKALLGIAAFTILSLILIPFLEFDYDFEKFFPQNDPETDFFIEFRDQFANDNDWVLVTLENEEGVFQEDFLQRVDSLANTLKDVKNVDLVTSPTQMKEPVRDQLFGMVINRPIIRIDKPKKYALDSTKIWDRGEMIGSLFAVDGKSMSINIQHKQRLSKSGCDTLAVDLQQVVGQFSFDKTHIVGRCIGQQYYVNMMQTELIIFVSLSIVLIILFLFIAFRSAWGIWVPLLVVLLSVVWILGIMRIAGKEIDIMLTILPTIIFVVGMSDVVHILTRFYEELRNGLTKIEAVKISFKEVGLATLLTSVTTAIGFLTLLTSSIVPIRSFGTYTAIGVFVAFILAYSLLPAVIILSKTPNVDSKRLTGTFWNKALHRGFGWMLRNQVMLIILTVLVAGASFYGISKVSVNNYILEDLKESDPLKQEFKFLEEKYAGARPLEIALTMKDGKEIWERETLVQMDSLSNFLTNDYGAGMLISPAQMVKSAWRAQKGGKDKNFAIPEKQKDIDQLIAGIEKFDRDSLMRMFVNPDTKMIRVSGMMGDLGSIEVRKRNELLMSYVDELNPNFDVRITGTATLIDANNQYLANDMVFGLLIAFFVVACIAGIMFRSFKMVIITLIPNILPLLMIAGIMGIAGIHLKVSTAIIFTIAFGIAVDDTIHFMSKLRIQLNKGRSVVYAVKRSFISTGKAIIVTSIILCGGFWTLLISDFLGTFYVGLLISLTLLFAVLSDLFLLPILVLKFFKPKPSVPK